MKNRSICCRLKNLREGQNLKQAFVADYLNISQQSYSKYENGQRELPIYHLEPLAKRYNVSADYLLGISINPKDLSSISQNIYKNNSIKEILNDITALTPENMSLLVTYIEFLKFKQNNEQK